MRIRFVFVVGAIALVTLPAAAGTVTINGGQTTWQSTQCPVPATPPGLSANPETRANAMNARVVEYNNYANAAQAYMNCVSNEAQQDSSAVSQSIVAQAQNLIAGVQQNVATLGAPLHLSKTAPAVSPAAASPPPGMAPATMPATAPSAPAAPSAAPPPSSTSTMPMAPSAPAVPATK